MEVKYSNRLVGFFIGSVALAAGIILFIYWNHFFNYLGYVVSTEPGDWGAFGDYFGGILNPIVGMLTLVLVAMTLRLTRDALIQNEKALEQAKEALEQGEKVIRQNAEELKLTRIELEKSSEAQTKIATLNEKELDNSIALRVIDETIRSHDSLHNTFLKLLRSTMVTVKFSEGAREDINIETAMDKIFSSRKRCIIKSSDNTKGFIFTLEELAEIAQSIAFLYSDIKTMNYNSLRNYNSQKAYTIPGSHQDLINFCRFTALSSILDEESGNHEGLEGLLHHGMMKSKIERIACHLGTSIDSLTKNFDGYTEREIQAISISF